MTTFSQAGTPTAPVVFPSTGTLPFDESILASVRSGRDAGRVTTFRDRTLARTAGKKMLIPTKTPGASKTLG